MAASVTQCLSGLSPLQDGQICGAVISWLILYVTCSPNWEDGLATHGLCLRANQGELGPMLHSSAWKAHRCQIIKHVAHSHCVERAGRPKPFGSMQLYASTQAQSIAEYASQTSMGGLLVNGLAAQPPSVLLLRSVRIDVQHVESFIKGSGW